MVKGRSEMLPPGPPNKIDRSGFIEYYFNGLGDSNYQDAIEDPAVVDMSISILHVVAVSLILFSISTVLFNMISGSGDTRSALQKLVDKFR